MNKMKKNLDKKFECPEGKECCSGLEAFSLGAGIIIEKTGSTYAITTNEGEYLGEMYCKNIKKCLEEYGDFINNSTTRIQSIN